MHCLLSDCNFIRFDKVPEHSLKRKNSDNGCVGKQHVFISRDTADVMFYNCMLLF